MRRFSFSIAASLALFLLPAPARADDIELIPITIGEARAAYSDAVFARNAAEAAKAGVDLATQDARHVVKGYANDRAYLLFYNHARALACARSYLIQRVCLTKVRDMGGGKVVTEKTYLVEALKLNDEKRTKKPDEHWKGYTRGEARRRTLIGEYEIGCGEVPGKAEGNPWPFGSGKLYQLIQPYTADAQLYTAVRFDFSRVYRLEMEFDDAGNHSIIAPDFLPAGE